MTIRKFRPEDRETLKEITAQTFEEVSIDKNIEEMFGIIAGHNWAQRKVRHIDADIEANADGILLAEENGEIIGYITSRVDQFSKIGGIPNMAVRPGQQGKGIGRKLIEACLDYLREVGMTHARIETLDQNPVGQHLYPACGFVEVARQIHYVMTLESA